MHRLPAFHLHLDDFAVSQHLLDDLLGPVKWHAAMKGITGTGWIRARPEKLDILFDQEAVRLGLVASRMQVRGATVSVRA